VADRPDQMVGPDVSIDLDRVKTYVSRGGDKLAAALDAFGIDPAGRVCLDVGASTGGFTDLLLQRGATRVIAVDVGYGQLAWSLRQDPRVTVLERVNIRHLDLLPVPADLAVIDVSFISLRLVLPRVPRPPQPAGRRGGAGQAAVRGWQGCRGKGGVVRDPDQHRQVLSEIRKFAEDAGYEVAGEIPSPILGAKGNREFLLHLRRHG